MPTTNERTEYGYRVRSSGHTPLAAAIAWSRDLMARVRADARPSFDLLIDLRGQVPYDTQVLDVVRRTRAWSHEHGVRRTAVISDDPELLLLTRLSARAVPGAHETERYFNALHGTTWEADALRWLRDGTEPVVARADEAAAELLSLFDALAQPLALLDCAGRFVRANVALRRHVGTPAAPERARGPRRRGATDRGGDDEGARVAADPLGAALLAAGAAYAVSAGRALVPIPETHVVALPSGDRWRLEMRAAPEGVLGAGRLLLVSAAPVAGRPLTDAELMARHGLTERELQVARLVADGVSNPQIAERLGTKRATARNQVSSVLRKLGAENRTALTALLLRGGA